MPDPLDEKRFVFENGVAGKIAGIVEPVIEDLGFRLVRVVVSGRDGGTVQVMAERADGELSVNECTTISRNLSPVMDAYDPMPSNYRLEVSSPGIDRPLVRPADFERHIGHEAKLELREMVDGRKRFRGVVGGFVDGEVRLRIRLEGADDVQELGFAVAMIESAKLVMTDELLKAAFDRAKR